MTSASPAEKPPLHHRAKRFLFGKPRDLGDRSLFKHLSLLPFLAWVGLGADGLSSSSYGPMEAFLTLKEHTYLAVGLAALTAATVFIIAAAYSHIIEDFPHGGGGYLVATKLLGPRWGVLSGSALLIDYVLTITVSIAAAGDALFSFLPAGWHQGKMGFEIFCIVGLMTLNIRGVKESVKVLLPIFLLFLGTHVVVLVGGIFGRAAAIADTARTAADGFHAGLAAPGFGIGAMALLFLHAYSLGGGTYTGIEAVSNGMPIMQEPRVKNGKRTMLYMAMSLAVTAGGLLVCYLLWDVSAVEGKTLNAVLVEKLVAGIPFGGAFVIATLFSEGGLLVVAAQAGFIDGPRVLANMAVDSWAPHRFAALSERLTTHNGIMLMGVAALAALLYTGGDVVKLVVMYSINVFLTFSLSMFGMARSYFEEAQGGAALETPLRAVRRRLPALRDDPGDHQRREVRRGRLDHARGHRGAGRALFRDPQPLPDRRRQARGTLCPARLAARGRRPDTGRAGPDQADRGRPRRQLWRARDPHGAQRLPLLPRSLQEPGVRLRRRHRLRRLQGRGDLRRAARAHRGDARAATCSSRAAWGSRPRTATRSAPTPSRRPTCSAAGSPRSSTAACSSPARSSSTASSGTRSSCTTRRPT